MKVIKSLKEVKRLCVCDMRSSHGVELRGHRVKPESLTVAVADPRAEAGGAGHLLPAGRLEARLLLLLLVLHLALAHPARCQEEGVISTHHGS